MPTIKLLCGAPRMSCRIMLAGQYMHRWAAGGKEYFRDRDGKEAVNDEVEPLQDVADRRRDDHATHRGRLRMRRDGRCVGGHAGSP